MRWQLFRNSLLQRNRRSELGLQWLGYLISAAFVVGSSIGFFAATVSLLPREKYILDVLLWVVFLVWQFMPVLFAGYSPGLDFREVARYPLSFRLYFLLNAAYGMFDPAALTGILWLFCIWLGVVVASPEWALSAALVFLFFVGFNVIGNRILVGLFDRFQSTRKGRERVAALLLVLALLPQMLQFVVNGWIDVRRFHLQQWQGVRDAVMVVLKISPPDLVSQAITQDIAGKFLPLAILLGYLLLALGILVRSMRRVYQGEVYAESFTIKRDLKIKPGWRLPLLDEAVSAIVEKELRYMRQNSRLLVQLVYPVIVFGFLVLGASGKRMSFFTGSSNVLSAFAGLMALSASNLSYNTFGMDHDGFGRWLLSPMSLRKIMLAKSMAQGIVMTALYLAGAVAIVSVVHVPLTAIIGTTAGFLCVLIVQLGAGNVISVYWPKKVEPSQMRSRMTSQAAGFASMAVNLPLMAIIGLVVMATWLWHLTWLPLVAGLAGFAASLKLFSSLLDWAERYAHEHLEEIAGKLTA